ncbi:hypothetical protein DICPUDRAFT_159681 [Dictyostelium purpureum]|uniref:Uncharacterized protein n=1 Tax=Dictyostelium purpureum TaxID=5786 RepID=F1A4Q5_DICPU|nr:uncharacterized protein DICPUDRAFT_159681 [Dictyostelium purpureum]EGC28826.1 hypothetical protein DICPUDRAFT_159681 [Dictyostelium purpureum]|eukprot:XP_003294647.1 hypothetical protein DICPUDRAFT_159681 [Dictyostelium purpureum]
MILAAFRQIRQNEHNKKYKVGEHIITQPQQQQKQPEAIAARQYSYKPCAPRLPEKKIVCSENEIKIPKGYIKERERLLEQLEFAQDLQSENHNTKSEITILQDKFSKESFNIGHDTLVGVSKVSPSSRTDRGDPSA